MLVVVYRAWYMGNYIGYLVVINQLNKDYENCIGGEGGVVMIVSHGPQNESEKWEKKWDPNMEEGKIVTPLVDTIPCPSY